MTVANQAYTFNGPTAHPHLSYGPGNLSMSLMVLPTPYPAPYATPYDQYQQYQQPQYNTFAKQGETNKTTPNNTTESILDQITKLLAS